MSSATIFFSFLGGVLPALLWLWFWLKEDRLHPEPRGLILVSFIVGMLAVIPAIPLEQWVWNSTQSMFLVIIGWAIIEETLKYGASYFSALRRSENDEPIDSLIYLITAALGFAALENALFLAGAVTHGGLISGVDLGLLRFVGASLLHVVTSGTLGFFLALGFYKRGAIKKIDGFIGLSAAIILHTLFNMYILKGQGDGGSTLAVFSFVWVAIILLLVGFEKIKQLKS
ncbi:MAG: PrsW family glutamic-type intramembrane protease [bacterium]|nr:PrsW family glutamic-type intramembrane protease [bacterium]